ncbi:MAG TPA: hypothetical protein VK964_09805 [Nocardioidaceae bacterium]|nr:hypothetical protein [Nocardioidaceae bacterium]
MIHEVDGRALVDTAQRATQRMLWWSLAVVGAVGMVIFVVLVGLLLWGIFTGVPGVASR